MAKVTVCDECCVAIIDSDASYAGYYASPKIRISVYFHLRKNGDDVPDLCQACKRKLIKQWAEDDEVWS